MTLKLTPERLASVYTMLLAWPPFNRWNLPKTDEVKFRVLRTKHWDADWWIEGGKHHVRVSEGRASHLTTIVQAMAHEMIHVKQHGDGSETKGVEHNADFQRIAQNLCKQYGWDFKQFL